MIDVASWPGYVLVAVGVMAIVGCLAALGTEHPGAAMVTALIALIAVTAGLVWLVFEHRRIRRLENHWQKNHPEVPRQPPAS